MTCPYYTDDEAKIDLVVSQAESFVKGQLTAAIAADQRALTFAALLVAGIAAMVGAVASAHAPRDVGGPVVLIGGALLLAAFCALWSARPTPWHLPGNEPANWLDDIQTEHDTMLMCKAMTAEIYQSVIDDNKREVGKAKRAMIAAMTITGVTLASALFWLAVRVASS